jgi:hypothetical protein
MRVGGASAIVTRQGGDVPPERGKRGTAPRAQRVERGPERSEGDAPGLMRTMIMKVKLHCRLFGSRDCNRRE